MHAPPPAPPTTTPTAQRAALHGFVPYQIGCSCWETLTGHDRLPGSEANTSVTSQIEQQGTNETELCIDLCREPCSAEAGVCILSLSHASARRGLRRQSQGALLAARRSSNNCDALHFRQRRPRSVAAPGNHMLAPHSSQPWRQAGWCLAWMQGVQSCGLPTTAIPRCSEVTWCKAPALVGKRALLRSQIQKMWSQNMWTCCAETLSSRSSA